MKNISRSFCILSIQNVQNFIESNKRSLVKIALKNPRIYFLLMTLFFVTTSAIAQNKTNLDVIRELSKRATDSILVRTEYSFGDTVSVSIKPSSDSWVVEYTIFNGLKENNVVCRKADSFSSLYNAIELAIIKMDVRYLRSFRDGFLGPKKVVRSVELELFAKVTKKDILINIEPIYQQYQDTVSLEAVNQLEDEHVQSSKGILPDEAIIDRIISPVIITSSVVVIVYLFFNLRK
jgi:hypothetical protein